MKTLSCANGSGNMLPGTPKIVINLKAVEYIDSGGLGVLVGLFVSARNCGGELNLKSEEGMLSWWPW
jgi:anti-anti-sigma factor